MKRTVCSQQSFDKNGNLAEDDNKRTIKQGIAYGIKKFHENFTNVDEAIIAGINYKFPLMKYNYRWKDLNKNDFVNLRGKYKFIAKGFIADKKAQRFEHGKTYLGKQNSKAEEIHKSILTKSLTFVKNIIAALHWFQFLQAQAGITASTMLLKSLQQKTI